MNKCTPCIGDYMTSMPHTIGPDQSIVAAKKIMQDLKVRHLPVRSGGKLVGVLSQGDIDLLYSFKDIDTKQALVCDAMVPEPYTVTADTSLCAVCDRMATDKIGSTLIVDQHDLLVGIFTYVDALRVLADRLKLSATN